MKRLIVDLDNTLTEGETVNYEDAIPRIEMIERLHDYKALGFEIAIHTSRNMRSYQGNVGKICANTVPVIIDWLKKYNVPFDEVWVGKPWCGHEGFYVDDRAVRPSEFLTKSYDDIRKLIHEESRLSK